MKRLRVKICYMHARTNAMIKRSLSIKGPPREPTSQTWDKWHPVWKRLSLGARKSAFQGLTYARNMRHECDSCWPTRTNINTRRSCCAVVISSTVVFLSAIRDNEQHSKPSGTYKKIMEYQTTWKVTPPNFQFIQWNAITGLHLKVCIFFLWQ